MHGHTHVIAELAKIPGVDFNLTTKEGGSPVFIAAQNGHMSVIKMLLQHGANCSIAFTSTAEDLRLFAEKKNKTLSERMERFIKCHSKEGSPMIYMTPYDISVIMGHQEIADMIHGANTVLYSKENRSSFFSSAELNSSSGASAMTHKYG